jgi:hypothetical protein
LIAARSGRRNNDEADEQQLSIFASFEAPSATDATSA